MNIENALILIVEDEPDIADVLCKYVEREGFKTVTARDGDAALMAHQQLRPNLVLLDVKLPKRDGFEVLAELRRRGATPVIMLTARAEDLDKLSALRMGADDYVVKPFNPLEVVARIKAVLRRVSALHVNDAPLRVGSLVIDRNALSISVVVGGTENRVSLTLAEFRVVDMLARSPRRIFSRMEIIDACFPDSDALGRVIDSHVSRARKKLADAGAMENIETVRGVGYKFEVGT